MLKRTRNNNGFTLMELMIAMVIASIVAAAIMMSFDSQQKTQVNQQLVVEMQQDERAALYLMQQDIRMAGYDETWEDSNSDGVDDIRGSDGIDNDGIGGPDSANEDSDIAGIVEARPNYIQIRLDENRNGDFRDDNDLVTYALASGTALTTIDPDGLADAGAMELKRCNKVGGNLERLADSVQAVAFGYAFDNDSPGGPGVPDGVIDTDGSGNIIWAFDSDGDYLLDKQFDGNGDGIIDESDTPVALTSTVPLDRIRAVRIWILARTRLPLRDHHNVQTYVVGDKVIAADDNYERVLLTTTVNCRNLGLRI
ncbi:MAG: prepilin-type N-terminal cleavage/methylation domain-containing protein [Desulfobacterales bacterium]